MVGRKRGDLPKSLVRGRDRFETWRRSRNVGTRIPDKLWSLAVKLAEAHGLSRTACLPQPLLPRWQVSASPCCSVALGMRAKICRTFCSIAPHSWRRPCRCATDSLGICPKDSTRSWQTGWLTAVATSWNFTIGSPKNVAT